VEVIRTDRLILRRLSPADAEFIFELVNDPDWLRYIGDRGVRTLDDARRYILQGPMAMYDARGYGLYCVVLRESGVPVGICGILKRDALEDVDIGFAFLPRFRSRGYAFEAAAATLEYGRQTLNLSRIVAIVSPENHVSRRLLEKLGFMCERRFEIAPGDEVCLFGPAPLGSSAAGVSNPTSQA